MTILSIMNEVLTMYSTISVGGGASGGGHTQRWERASSFRSAVGELVLSPFLESFELGVGSSTISSSSNNNRSITANSINNKQEVDDLLEDLSQMIKVWGQIDSIGSLTLLDELKNRLKRIQLKLSEGSAGSEGNNDDDDVVMSNIPNDSDNISNQIIDANDENANESMSVENTVIEEEKVVTTTTTTTSTSITKPDTIQPSKEESPTNATTTSEDLPMTPTDDTNSTNVVAVSAPTSPEEADDISGTEDGVTTPIPSDGEDMFGETQEGNDFIMTDDGDDGTSDTTPSQDKTEVKENKVENTPETKDSLDPDFKKPPFQKSPSLKAIEQKKEDESKASLGQSKEFDFETEGIPHAKVSVNEILQPCRTIASMQITRDLRSDVAHNVSTIFSTIPPEILDTCKSTLDTMTEKDIGNSTSDSTKPKVDLSTIPPLPDAVLDLDISATSENIRNHREIIAKQRDARQKSIEMLVKSRCQFGSSEAAGLFYSVDKHIQKLKDRKVRISDAMELEMIFDEENDEDLTKDDKKYDDFKWFPRDKAGTDTEG